MFASLFALVSGQTMTCGDVSTLYHAAHCCGQPDQPMTSETCPMVSAAPLDVMAFPTHQSKAFAKDIKNNAASPLSWLRVVPYVSTLHGGKHGTDEYDLTITPFGNNSAYDLMTLVSSVQSGTETTFNQWGDPTATGDAVVDVALTAGTASATGTVTIGTDYGYVPLYSAEEPNAQNPPKLYLTNVTSSTFSMPAAQAVRSIGLDFPLLNFACVEPDQSMPEIDEFVFTAILAITCGAHMFPGYTIPAFNYDTFQYDIVAFPYAVKDQICTDGLPKTVTRMHGKFAHPNYADAVKLTKLTADYDSTAHAIKVWRTHAEDGTGLDVVVEYHTIYLAA